MNLQALARPAALAAAVLTLSTLSPPSRGDGGQSGETIFVSVPRAGVVRAYDRATLGSVGTYTGASRPGAVALTPDGARLLAVDMEDVRLVVWDVASGTRLANPQLLGGDANLQDVCVSPDGELAWVTSGGGARIVVVDLGTYQELDSYSFPYVGIYPDGAGIAITPDGAKVFAVDTASRRLHTFRTQTRAFEGTGAEIPYGAVEVAVCADGAHGIVVGDGEPAFFSTATGAVTSLGVYRGLQRDVTIVGDVAYVTNTYTSTIQFKSAGPRAAPSEGQRAIDVYDVSTGEYLGSHALPDLGDAMGIAAYDASNLWVCMGVEGGGDLVEMDGTDGDAGRTVNTSGEAYRAVIRRSGGTTVVSFFLPTQVKLRLAGAGKDLLVTGGLFDDGDLPVDFTEPVTLEVGEFTRTFSLVPNRKGTAYSYRSPEIVLSLTPNLRGSSRGRFKLKIQKTTLTGLVAPDGPAEIHFRATGLPDMAGTVVLEKGGYRRARKRGALLDPPFFAGLGQFTLKGDGEDGCVVRWGFSGGAETPDGLSEVRIGIGALNLRIPGSEFTRIAKPGEECFVATIEDGAAKVTVSLDYKRELARVVAKHVELGGLAPGTATDFVLDPGNGAGTMTNHVRLGGAGKKVFY